jgi:hypothetical protein
MNNPSSHFFSVSPRFRVNQAFFLFARRRGGAEGVGV